MSTLNLFPRRGPPCSLKPVSCYSESRGWKDLVEDKAHCQLRSAPQDHLSGLAKGKQKRNEVCLSVWTGRCYLVEMHQKKRKTSANFTIGENSGFCVIYLKLDVNIWEEEILSRSPVCLQLDLFFILFFPKLFHIAGVKPAITQRLEIRVNQAFLFLWKGILWGTNKSRRKFSQCML